MTLSKKKKQITPLKARGEDWAVQFSIFFFLRIRMFLGIFGINFQELLKSCLKKVMQTLISIYGPILSVVEFAFQSVFCLGMH
jgi:hypothetical protein